MEKVNPVPVELAFGIHDIEHKHHLNLYRDRIESILATQLKGRVAVFVEDVGGSFLGSITEIHLVSQGELPTDAFVKTNYISEHGKLPTNEEFEAYKPDALARMDPFVMHQYNLLDEIARRYPGRLYLLPEWQEDETLDSIFDENGRIRSLVMKRHALEVAYGGDFSAALPIFQETVELQAENDSKRDEQILKYIQTALGYEDIVGFVGFIGAAHTSLSHGLKKAGYNVIRTFPGKEDGKFIYDPSTVASRFRSFFPDRDINRDDWMILLTQTVIFESLKAISELNNFPFPEQMICGQVWKATKNFSPVDVKELEEDLKEKGIERAPLEFLQQLLSSNL